MTPEWGLRLCASPGQKAVEQPAHGPSERQGPSHEVAGLLLLGVGSSQRSGAPKG